MKQGKALVAYSRYLAAAFAIALSLAYPVWLSNAQQKNAPKAPPAPPKANATKQSVRPAWRRTQAKDGWEND